MKIVRPGLITVAALLFCATLLSARVVDLEPERGQSVASIRWVDDTGRVRQMSDFAGFPVVLLPIYTRCKTACIANTDQLKKTLADASVDPTQFRVLLFSFDPTDSPATLAAYRRREKIPLGWSVGSASQPEIEHLLETIGFQAAKSGSEFMHTNLVVFLDANLRIAKWIYGTDYSGRDVEKALKVAAGQNDWIGQHAQWLYALALFGTSILCVVLINYLIQLRRAVDVAL